MTDHPAIEPCPCGAHAIITPNARHVRCSVDTCWVGPLAESREAAIADWNRVAGQRWRFDTPPLNQSVLINVPDAEHYGPGIYRAVRVDFDYPPRWHTTAVSMGRDIPGDRVKGWRPLPDPPEGGTP